MKTIFVYFSMSGNGDFIADHLKEKGMDILKLELEKPFPKGKFLTYFLGGMQAFFHREPKLKNKHIDVTSYDQIIIGTPIWNGTCATPINTFLNATSLKNKKLSIIAYSGSGKANKLKAYVEKTYVLDSFLSLKKPLQHQQETIISLNELIN